MRIAAIVASALWLSGAVAWATPPTVQSATPFASGLGGPEGLAFGRDGSLYAGVANGDILRISIDGTPTVIASTGDNLAGLTLMKDGSILACGFDNGRVWRIDPINGGATVYATVDSPNFVVETRRGHVIVSSTFSGTVVDVTNGAHVVLASGFPFPNGLALRQKYLYMADTALGQVVRFPFTTPGTLGPPETYATGVSFADGIAFDRPGNLFVVGFDKLYLVDVLTRTVQTFNDPLFDWPSNIAFGRTSLNGRMTMYLANYGPGLGDGTTIVRVPTNHTGARLIR